MEEIIKFIPYGRTNRITALRLKAILNIDYNEVKIAIKELRKKYVIFVDKSDGGYWRSNNIEELEHFIKEQQKHIFENTRAIEIANKEIGELRKEK